MGAYHPWIRTRLAVMMFLELAVWDAWYPPVGSYMNKGLRLGGQQIGWISATCALGAIVAPLAVGYVADRWFATERVLAVLHLVGGICLLASANQTEFAPLMVLLTINALCFMPTMALANSLAFRNIDDPARFSRIAVWGTIGWMSVGWLVGFTLAGPTDNRFFFLAGGLGIVMALYSLSLPHTPPKGGGSGDVLGLGAVRLLKDTSFLVFAACALLISIPFGFYGTWTNAFLEETGCPYPTALQTLCQFSSVVVLLAMPRVIGAIGLRNVLAVGMASWAVRYLLFATQSFPLILAGLLVHGISYGFVFVAASIYVDRTAPPEMSARAQSLVALLMWGVGMFVGNQLAGFTGDQYLLPARHDWTPIWLWPAGLATLVCIVFLAGSRATGSPRSG
jgi:nucleoside transporter